MLERKRIRVMHVVSSLGTYGAEQVVLQLSRAFPRDAFETSVMTIYSPDPVVAAAQHEAGIALFDMRRGGRFDATLLPRMIATIALRRPDIVHTHTHYGKYWGRVAALAAFTPTIVHTEHNSEFESKPAYRAVNAQLHRRTAAIVAFSQIHKDRLAEAESIDRARMHVIPNGIVTPPVDCDRSLRAELAGADAATVMLHIGRLSPVKNQALAIDAFHAAMQRERRPLRLYLAGDGEDRGALEARVRTLGIADRVGFLGFRTDVAALLAASDRCIVTSRNEAMPIAVLEAMFAATPIVSTPWIGAAELFEDGTLASICTEPAPDSLADAIVASLNDSTSAAAKAERAAERAQARYTIDAMANAHASLYAQLFTARKAAR